MLKYLRLFSGLFLFSAASLNVFCQSPQMQANPPKNWQNEGIEKDSVYGTGSDKALELLKGLPSVPVVVAVVDGGVYINHPYLKNHIWTNAKEIAGNKIDDDHNGYIDDIHGWDFIGGKDSDIKQETVEVTRLYRELGKKYANTAADKVAKADKEEYNKYLKVKKSFESSKAVYQVQYDNLKMFIDNVDRLEEAMGKKDVTKEDLDAYNPTDSTLIKTKGKLSRTLTMMQSFIKGATADSLKKQFKPALNQLSTFVNYQYNVDFNPRYIVGDNYADANERYYGNNDVIGPTDLHATHVSGIIAGNRTGKPGDAEGIADNAVIMAVRVVPDGDERDKDVANGIRYAVDNGAKVINMSFGKQFSYNKKVVDDAVKYAEAHDVLLVHAAGNDHNNTDSTDNFPKRQYEGSHKEAQNWIEVGASDVHGNPGSFSNYGKKSVDLFAPGVKIYSSVPDTGFAYLNGTSMASPCVAGVATIIREYFPKLSAKQVKKILMKSVTPITTKVPMPGHKDKLVSYSDLCVSGGIVNATKAVELAMKESGVKALKVDKAFKN